MTYYVGLDVSQKTTAVCVVLPCMDAPDLQE